MGNSTIKLMLICISLLFVGIRSQIKLLSIRYTTTQTILKFQVPANQLFVLNFTYISADGKGGPHIVQIERLSRLPVNFKQNYTAQPNNVNVVYNFHPHHQITGQLVNYESEYKITFNQEPNSKAPYLYTCYVVQNNQSSIVINFEKNRGRLWLSAKNIQKKINRPSKFQFLNLQPGIFMLFRFSDFTDKKIQLPAGTSDLIDNESNNYTQYDQVAFGSAENVSICDMSFNFNNRSSICGNMLIENKESCDNGNQTGCINCTVNKGYQCVKNQKNSSSCFATCGDGLRYGDEACDNKNGKGCSSNCKIDRGYYCTGAIGQASTCVTRCGDMIKAGQEQCDNGNKVGCTNCRIDPGYACTQTTNGGSNCYKV